MTANLVTLLTDFGLRDPFVGVMKGVIHAVAPAVRVIDLGHEIAPQDVAQAGLWWARTTPFFPAGAVHVGVVDPGVGGEREIIAARVRVSLRCFTPAALDSTPGGPSVGESIFLAPDNGLLGHVVDERDIVEVVCVREAAYRLPEVSSTFHGRDIFAPVAAHLARGLPVAELGPAATRIDLRGPERPTRTVATGRAGEPIEVVSGRVREIDRFGNASTDIALTPEEVERVLEVRAAGRSFESLHRFYSQVAAGESIVLVDSWGFLEVAINRGNAARELGFAKEDLVEVVLRENPTRRGQENRAKGRRQ